MLVKVRRTPSKTKTKARDVLQQIVTRRLLTNAVATSGLAPAQVIAALGVVQEGKLDQVDPKDKEALQQVLRKLEPELFKTAAAKAAAAARRRKARATATGPMPLGRVRKPRESVR
jgi:hypothetical protein